MFDRNAIENELGRIETAIRELDQGYEKYFMGIERRPPEKERDEVGRVLRRISNRYIPQTDLRYRYQTIATRFHAYCANWDRTMRLIDEGKFVRQLRNLKKSAATELPLAGEVRPPAEVDRIYAEIQAIGGSSANREQLAAFLDHQRRLLSDKLGGREVEFVVVEEAGKAKIKARPRKQE